MFTNCFLPLLEFLRSCFLHVAIVLNPDVWFLTWGKAILPNDGWLIFVGVVAMVFTGSCLHHHHHHQWHLIAMNYWNKMITTTPPPPPPFAILLLLLLWLLHLGERLPKITIGLEIWGLSSFFVFCTGFFFYLPFYSFLENRQTFLYIIVRVLQNPTLSSDWFKQN